MDEATIQQRIWSGYGKAATYVGRAYTHYRPAGASAPMAASNALASLKAAFTAPPTGFDFGRAPSYKDAAFTGLFDAADVAVGDYLAAPGLPTFFVASLAPLRPPLCILCNRVLTISAPGPSGVAGLQGAYEGTDPADETPVMTGWPASVLFDARGRARDVGLPLDLPSPFYAMLAPALAGVDVRSGMITTDDLGRRYDVAGTELSSFGWRIWAQISTT